MKTEIIRLRCSELDKQKAQEQANKRQMSLSEYILYLIRKDEERPAD